MSLSFNSSDKKYDFTLVSLWSHQVSVNPLYHFVRTAINKITADTTQEKLRQFRPDILITNAEKSVMRYQVKYPLAPGLLVLAAVLEEKYSVNIVSFDVEKEKLNSEDWLDRIIKEIARETKYGCLVSFVTPEIDQLYTFANQLKEADTTIKVIVGGVHATYNDKDLIKNTDIDFVIRGEGEITVRELCDTIVEPISFEGIPGITYRDKEAIVRTRDRELMDLSLTPIPAYHLINDYIDHVVISTMFSRGCPYQCSYCAESAFWTSNVRYKDVSKFVDELELLVNQYNLHFIHIADSTFGVNKEKLIELCDELERRKIKAFFSVNIRPNVFDYMGEELIKRLRDLNFVEMLMGVESADPKVLNYFSRTQNNNSLYNTLSRLKAIGIRFIKLYLMFGSPNDTRVSLEKTAQMVEDLLTNKLIFYATGKYYVPSIGSVVYKELGNDELRSCESVRLDRYNSPPLFVPDGTVAQEMDLYLQLIQVVQYKYYLKNSSIEVQEWAKSEWEKYVATQYVKGYYF